MIDAAGILFVCAEDGTALCMRRGNGDEPNTWTPPGGGRRPGETHRQAAEREAGEELGLASWPATNRQYGTLTDENGFVTFVDLVPLQWKKALARHDFSNRETAEVAWLPLRALPEELHPGFRRVLAQQITDVVGRPDTDAPDTSIERATHLNEPNPGIILDDLGPWSGLNLMTPHQAG